MKFCLGLALASVAMLLSSAEALVLVPGCAGVPPESSAISNLRTINTAEVTYLSSESRYGTIGELVTSGLLDPRLRTTVSDYNFVVTPSGADYTVTAEPNTPDLRFNYYSGPDGVVRYGGMAPANLIGTPTS